MTPTREFVADALSSAILDPRLRAWSDVHPDGAGGSLAFGQAMASRPREGRTAAPLSVN